jgi:hypothetical protein
LSPRNKSISHSLSELALRRAERSNNSLEREKFRNESRKIAEGLIHDHYKTSHPFHTILKGSLNELADVIKENTDSIRLEKLTKEIGNNISNALQEFPDDSFLLEADSKFNELLKSNVNALESLKKAFQSNKKSAYIALRLANMISESGDEPEAINVGSSVANLL